MAKRIDGLAHVVGGHVCQAQIGIDGGLLVARRHEVEGGAIGLDGIDRTPQ